MVKGFTCLEKTPEVPVEQAWDGSTAGCEDEGGTHRLTGVRS